MKFITVFLVMLFFDCAYANSKFDVMVEVGGLWQHRNDTQIPPDTGTRFAIDEIDEGPFFHHRLEAYYRVNVHHAVRLVYAPSTIEVTGRSEETVVFNGESFSNAEDLTVKYRFNSYRLSYIYGFRGFGDSQVNIGLTGKVRDAETTFSQPGVSSSYDNIGFVPLLYFEYQAFLSSNWSVNFVIDAAAAPQGRAFDGAFKIRRQIGKSSSLGIGLRSLEGGADNDKVFTFSWFNYALLELKIGF